MLSKTKRPRQIPPKNQKKQFLTSRILIFQNGTSMSEKCAAQITIERKRTQTKRTTSLSRITNWNQKETEEFARVAFVYNREPPRK